MIGIEPGFGQGGCWRSDLQRSIQALNELWAMACRRKEAELRQGQLVSRSRSLLQAPVVGAAGIAVVGHNTVDIGRSRRDVLLHHTAEDTVVAAAHSTAARILGVAVGVATVALAVPVVLAVLVGSAVAGPGGSVGPSVADSTAP